MDARAPVIELDRVTKVFATEAGDVRALDGVSFSCPARAFWSIMGRSGSGKSTVLHVIAGLTPPTSGIVRVEGVDVARMAREESAVLRRRRIGYVLQAFNLIPFLSAQENVAVPLLLDGIARGEAMRRSREMLALVDLEDRATHRPSQLSGGEQQRIAVARALVIAPAIVLADEPTGNLDQGSGRGVMDLLRDVNKRLGVTVLVVTHDPVFAAYAECVLHMSDGRLDADAGGAGALRSTVGRD